MSTRAVPILDETGAVREWIGTNTDITDRRRAEEELKRSNEDLERFAYAASHDLQEPLRAVTTYTQLLDRQYRRQLDANAGTLIETILNSAGRMQQLIRDLLAYAQAGQADETVPTEADEALALALETLRPQRDECGARIEAAPLPQVLAHSGQLARVFQNLVGNAIKYRHPARPPVISIAATRERETWIISVRDNGLGFHADQATEIFLPFKRLAGDRQTGTGLGLAICQRLVERWGGAIWAESERGAGSVFHLRLPAARLRTESAGASQ